MEQCASPTILTYSCPTVRLNKMHRVQTFRNYVRVPFSHACMCCRAGLSLCLVLCFWFLPCDALYVFALQKVPVIVGGQSCESCGTASYYFGPYSRNGVSEDQFRTALVSEPVLPVCLIGFK